jgi:hypothetical protein
MIPMTPDAIKRRLENHAENRGGNISEYPSDNETE